MLKKEIYDINTCEIESHYSDISQKFIVYANFPDGKRVKVIIKASDLPVKNSEAYILSVIEDELMEDKIGGVK